MNISYFRDNLKECLDNALAGELVSIERGGVTFSLTANVVAQKAGGAGVPMQRNARATTLQERADGLGESVELPPTPIKRPTERPPVPAIPGLITADKMQQNGTCKVHGLALDRRGKCMQKGCKYA